MLLVLDMLHLRLLHLMSLLIELLHFKKLMFGIYMPRLVIIELLQTLKTRLLMLRFFFHWIHEEAKSSRSQLDKELTKALFSHVTIIFASLILMWIYLHFSGSSPYCFT